MQGGKMLGGKKMNTKEVWFSHREEKWDVTDGKFSWTGKEEIWDFDQCVIGIARTIENKLIGVVRSRTNKTSEYMEKPVELRFMLGFPIDRVSEPTTELYTARKNIPGKKEGPRERWVSQLGDKYWIWEWAEEGKDIRSSNVYQLYQLIKQEGLSPSIKSDNIFDVEDGENIEDNNEIIPVIYQPAVDKLKNFVREVHCAKKPANTDGSYEVEVTIVFNDEHLQKWKADLDNLYRKWRGKYHGRVFDIETFKIMVKKDLKDSEFTFETTYSDGHQLEDVYHGDSCSRIKYFFMSHNHPVIFINTCNHSMAEHDTNDRLWKWEYIPWLESAPIDFGKKTRQEVEEDYYNSWQKRLKDIGFHI